MGQEQRRSPRIEVSLPVRVVVHDQAEDRILATGEGRINDISRHGLRLTLLQPKIGGWHIFYHFHDREEGDPHLLFLEVQDRDGKAPDFRLPVQPVWFDRLLSLPAKPFQLGMEFRREPPREVIDWLNRLLQNQPGQKADGWLARLFGS